MAYVVRTEKAIQSSKKGKRVILEEGLLHYFLSMYERGVLEDEARKYFNKAVFSDFFIILNLDKETSLTNIEGRGEVPRDRFGIDTNEWLSLLDNNFSVYKNIIRETASKDRIINIDSRNKIGDDTVEMILSKIGR